MSSSDSILTYEALPARVRFGNGALGVLADEVALLKCRRALLINGLSNAATAERVARDIGPSHIQTIDVRRQHVPATLATEALVVARRQRVDCLIALGGGSSVGVAKAVARTTTLPIVAVPTTYAGSEMTPIWGITENGVKTTGRDVRVLPRTVVYDPELTLDLPPATSGASGMNAIAHCVEAMWAENRNPVTDAVATEGIALLAAGLRGAIVDPDDLYSRGLALRGAWLAGTALAVAGTALHHKICHVLGGAFDLPHAETHSTVLPWVIDHFRNAAPDACERVSKALGAEDPVQGVIRLALDLQTGFGLEALGLTASGADTAAEIIAAGAPAVPAPVSAAEVRAILYRAMATPSTLSRWPSV
jgi:alcohol dehydrogenase class IV